MGNRAGLPLALEGLKKVGSYSNYDIFYDKDIFKPFLPIIINDLKPLLDYPDFPTVVTVAKILISICADEGVRKKIKEIAIEELKRHNFLYLDFVCPFMPEDIQLFKEIVNVGSELINNGKDLIIAKCDDPESLIDLVNKAKSKSPSDIEQEFYQKMLT
ncbi:MAG: hypothetical protein A2Y62_19890 [Candidatus Fischerbacteria bacterium RBG_13_37_8]|uniref:Uncharacterized protein n=1 Tax=Candidatus Fischerbacteria bacterium RBG_13_37_8 TaxID=1817863 RepID=A0A1F5VNT6_9BACT|nr:MAG: hypothetical protein A2Y62_19890 [Candidatus Fischerbacteria bacterium RBG_13_37_8]